jgi:tetratricopeptide (TPR) repeat protein
MKYFSGLLATLLFLGVVTGWSAAQDVQTYVNQGIKYSQEGHYDQALKAFDQALKLKPKDPALITYKGIVYYAMGQNSRAMPLFEEAIKLNPNFGRAYYQRGMIYEKQERYDQALADLQKAKNLGYGVDPDFIAYMKRKAAGQQRK